ncbi:hypothetical protein [Paenarthrobacter aurescens]|uniref:hypothetical protein n=1 Tax=Paenarthrobacter aurescens TaxID=43663 RepID=UPI0021C125FC|nr:hypothetical protein [Paenarthrobacter aurescens]MCT9868998.1 hypothetical protein [Paenarthrobacter aurescens]
MAVLLVIITALLFPGPPPVAPGAARNLRSVDENSVVAFYVAAENAVAANLSWSWKIEGGKSEATLFASVGSMARGSLVFGGPIAQLTTDCFVVEEAVNAVPGLPDRLGFSPPDLKLWFGKRPSGSLAHIDFREDQAEDFGITSITCKIRDFGSDTPPVHRLYTPALLAYFRGSESATFEQQQLSNVCVEVSARSRTDVARECAERFRAVPYLSAREQVVSLPEEQGYRDGVLLILGAVAGTAAASVLEILTGLFSAILSGFWLTLRRVLAAATSRLKGDR